MTYHGEYMTPLDDNNQPQIAVDHRQNGASWSAAIDNVERKSPNMSVYYGQGLEEATVTAIRADDTYIELWCEEEPDVQIP